VDPQMIFGIGLCRLASALSSSIRLPDFPLLAGCGFRLEAREVAFPIVTARQCDRAARLYR
ncbi:hypothetical protein JYB64_24465, partial [Algoriphagus aestuarii]|nr:hypothetical protein [Algoriphagus aestuarii]